MKDSKDSHNTQHVHNAKGRKYLQSLKTCFVALPHENLIILIKEC